MTELPLRNPFANNVVAGPRERPEVDVPAIHDAVYRACADAVEQVRLSRESSSVLIYGEPGSGKTHLLARLRAELKRRALGHLAAMANVVAVKLNTVSSRIWRHLREQVADDLREELDGCCCLHWLLAARLHAEERVAQTGDTRRYAERWLTWLRQPKKDEAGVTRFLEGAVPNRDLFTVLLHLLLERHVRDAWAWLRGDSLPESVLDRLQVAADTAEDEDTVEQRAREVVFTVCRVATPVPFVFCFDQLESLESGIGREVGIRAFGRMAAELHDGVSNVVLVSCVQSTFVQDLLERMRAPDRDRVAQRRLQLEPLSRPEGEELIRRRLDAVPELAKLRTGRGGLWPVDRRDLRPLLERGDCVARKLLAHCAQLYDRARGLTGEPHAVAPDPRLSLPEFVDESFSRRFEGALAVESPRDADAILQAGLPPALAAAAPGTGVRPDGAHRDVNLVCEGPAGRIGISFCNHSNLTSLAARLRRLARASKDGTLGVDRLVLVRHPALAVSRGATRAREYLRELGAGGSRLCHPSREALAALAALRDLLADARAGDLAVAGDPVPPASVEEWVSTHLPGCLRDLAADLLATSAAADPAAEELREELLEWLESRHLAVVDDAAAALDRPAADVAASARAHPRHFGLLEGPPALVYLHVPASVPDADEEE